MAATYADEAFERLYARYGREVYRYALALLRNPAEAEDATQTTFLNAYRALRAGERPRRPHNWLIAIAHNACRSRVRFAMRRPNEVPLDDVVEQLAVPEAERPNIRELVRMMGRLPVNQRAAITMREFEGRSYVDIAERLGVTVPAAEALIGRARRTLRERAAAFRTLVLVPLPRSFRKAAENGEVAGGAAGTAVAAKVAALLVVGAVGGGVGVAAGGGSHSPAAQVEPSGAVLHPASGSTPAPLSGGPAARAGASLATPAAQPQTARLPSAAMVAQPPPAAAAAPSAGVPAPAASNATDAIAATVGTTAGTTVAGAAAQVTKAITTAVSQLPTVTTPPVSTPAATTPPVTTPAVTTPATTVPPVTVPTVTVPTVTVPPLP